MGTAFYIGGGFVLTALHVVADTKNEPVTFYNEPIVLEFPMVGHTTYARVVGKFWNRLYDWAVIECDDHPPTDPIEFGLLPQKDEAWESFGYPKIHLDGMRIIGTVRDPINTRGDAKVIQLYCEDAAAGAGARLHGFSGAPCLVGGKAVGVLCSTLIETLPDGRLKLQLFTQAGAVFACPSKEIINWQVNAGKAVLLDNWTPLSIVLSDFVVILSQAERNANPKLMSVANQTHRHVKAFGLEKPQHLYAEDAVSSEKNLMQAVEILCRASVVVFDATKFEPAVMLLMGIRAVVKRGVTILSIGGDYALGKHLDKIPFNIKDANIVAHSKAQDDSIYLNSVSLLTTRVKRGLVDLDSPRYLDLPVFDTIRGIPVDRRGIISKEEGVLLLCSFDQDYTKKNWEKNLKHALEDELKYLNPNRNTGTLGLGVARSFELNSPRLVSQALYEAIRRTQACIVDFTNWSENVLFELGVRLAASSQPPVCTIEKGDSKNPPKEFEKQCGYIQTLFVSDNAIYDVSKSWMDQAAYRMIYGEKVELPPTGPARGSIHSLIEKVINIDNEPASRPVYKELQNSAKLFERPPGAATKPVGLFPGNIELTRREEEAEFERLIAAWLYLSNRFGEEMILNDDDLSESANEVIISLFERHPSRLEEMPSISNDLGDMQDKIDQKGGWDG